MSTSVALRASAAFPPGPYRTLVRIARQKKVSIAWVVRDAVEKYVEEKGPLFKTEDVQR